MKNPSYLILSRHNVYYFRWPMPQAIRQAGLTGYLKISLRTRDPKEALQLANVLSYHAHVLTNSEIVKHMNYGDVIAELKEYFYELINEKKAEIHRTGPLGYDEVDRLVDEVKLASRAIEEERDELTTADDLRDRLQPITSRFDPELSEGQEGYEILKSNYKLAYKGYCEKLISHNHKQSDFQFSTRPAYLEIVKQQKQLGKPEHRLDNAIKKYLAEMKASDVWGQRTEEERIDCLNYLMECLGADRDILSIDKAAAREVKEALILTPVNRGKLKATRDLPLHEQIKVGGLNPLSVGSVNKYIQCYSGLFTRLSETHDGVSNPFKGMKLPEPKKNKAKKKRDMFNEEAVNKILFELNKGQGGYAKHPRNYWGVLIALYTGARLNEIASLTPDDVKQDESTGIWYFDINDEEETKRLKTESAARRVPIHSELLNRGILAYVDEVKSMEGKGLRLLYDLTLSEKEGWGRKLGRWFNETFLKKLDLKREKLSFHSMRHTVITKLRQAGVSNHDVRPIVGHTPEGVTEKNYNHGDFLALMKDNLEKLQY